MNSGLTVNRGDHPFPYTFSGPKLDWAIWRTAVDQGIKNPEYTQEQILKRQTELQEQGETLDGQIARLRILLNEIADERSAYQRMLARNRITEEEFDNRMDETKDAVEFSQSELAQLVELRDDQQKVDAGIRYTQELFRAINEDLREIDLPLEEFEPLSSDQKHYVIEMRQKVIRALVDKVIIYSDDRVVLEGVLDGTEICQFGSLTPATGSQTAERFRRCAGCSEPVG
jgi:hypothetical protein